MLSFSIKKMTLSMLLILVTYSTSLLECILCKLQELKCRIQKKLDENKCITWEAEILKNQFRKIMSKKIYLEYKKTSSKMGRDQKENQFLYLKELILRTEWLRVTEKSMSAGHEYYRGELYKKIKDKECLNLLGRYGFFSYDVIYYFLKMETASERCEEWKMNEYEMVSLDPESMNSFEELCEQIWEMSQYYYYKRPIKENTKLKTIYNTKLF